MKPLLILLAFCSSFFAQAANEPNTNTTPQQVIRSFESTFAGAADVHWSLSADKLYKVSFQVAGQYAQAYYSEAGELVVITRNISPLQLPVVLLAALKKDHPQQWIADVVEVSNEAGTHYYVTIEDGIQKLTLKSYGTTNWVRFQKTEK